MATRLSWTFVGRIDGEAFDGGAGEDFPLVLGSGQFIPGFEEQLVGVKAEEEKDVTVTSPRNTAPKTWRAKRPCSLAPSKR